MTSQIRTIRELMPRGKSPTNSLRYGIELEFESPNPTRLNVLSPPWNIVPDGSLRDNGIELISSPLSKEEIQPALESAYTWVARHRYGPSVRTGMHVHVNMAGRPADTFAKVLAAYIMVEPMLFAFAGEHRRDNIYCVPWFHDPSQMDAARAMITAGIKGVPYWYANEEYFCKYSALNLRPLFRQHTIEFRHLGTPSLENAIKWCDAIHTLVEIAPSAYCNLTTMPNTVIEAVGDILGERYKSTGMAEIEEEATIDVGLGFLSDLVCTYKPTNWGVPTGLLPDVSKKTIRKVKRSNNYVRNMGTGTRQNNELNRRAEVPPDLHGGRVSEGRTRGRNVPAAERDNEAVVRAYRDGISRLATEWLTYAANSQGDGLRIRPAVSTGDDESTGISITQQRVGSSRA